MHDEPTLQQGLPPLQPTGDLLMAQALEACLRAEREAPGSSEPILTLAPATSRDELRQLVRIARALDAAAPKASPSPAFREAARSRLMQQIAGQSGAPLTLTPRLRSVPPARRGGGLRRRLAWRGTASLLAAVLGVTATLTASAQALPGDPLYPVKQAQEELNLRLAADDEARVQALLGSADARLEETSRLLQLGRAEDAAAAAQRYDETIERATTTYVVLVDTANADPETATPVQVKLTEHQQRLEALVAHAPAAAREDLQEALESAERGRELVSDPRQVERALGRGDTGPAPVAAAAPATATALPTRQPRPTAAARLAEQPTAVPSPTAPEPTAVVATQPEESAPVADDTPTHESEQAVAPPESAAAAPPPPAQAVLQPTATRTVAQLDVRRGPQRLPTNQPVAEDHGGPGPNLGGRGDDHEGDDVALAPAPGGDSADVSSPTERSRSGGDDRSAGGGNDGSGGGIVRPVNGGNGRSGLSANDGSGAAREHAHGGAIAGPSGGVGEDRSGDDGSASRADQGQLPDIARLQGRETGGGSEHGGDTGGGDNGGGGGGDDTSGGGGERGQAMPVVVPTDIAAGLARTGGASGTATASSGSGRGQQQGGGGDGGGDGAPGAAPARAAQATVAPPVALRGQDGSSAPNQGGDSRGHGDDDNRTPQPVTPPRATSTPQPTSTPVPARVPPTPTLTPTSTATVVARSTPDARPSPTRSSDGRNRGSGRGEDPTRTPSDG